MFKGKVILGLHVTVNQNSDFIFMIHLGSAGIMHRRQCII